MVTLTYNANKSQLTQNWMPSIRTSHSLDEQHLHTQVSSTLCEWRRHCRFSRPKDVSQLTPAPVEKGSHSFKCLPELQFTLFSPCRVGGIPSQDIKEPFLDNYQKAAFCFSLTWCFTLGHDLSLPCVYDRKHIHRLKRGKLAMSLHRHSKHFFFFFFFFLRSATNHPAVKEKWRGHTHCLGGKKK